MKTKLMAILPMALLFSSLLNAQYTDFDISKYKLPDIKMSSLDFTFDLNHSFQSIKLDLNNTTQQDYNTRNFGGLFYPRFYHFRNKSNYQGSQFASIYVSPDYYKRSESDNDVSKNNNFRIDGNLSSYNKFYNSSFNFIEVDPSITYSYDNSYDVSTSSSERDKLNYFNISAPVSVGHGRIEPVEDARLAVYILDELSKHDKIINQPTEAKILELAAEISKIKRKRFFDFRIRRIAELQAVDSFLVANNIVSSNDIVYFTQLSDQWDYASGPARNSGFAVNFGINDEISLSNTKSKILYDETFTANDTSRINKYTTGAFARMQYSKPLNLCWQTDLSLKLSYDYSMTRDPSEGSSITDDYNTHILYPDLSYSLEYLPNSRTSIGLSIGTTYRFTTGKRKASDVINGSMSGNDFYTHAGINMYYYFSPQLRLQAIWNLQYYDQKQDVDYGNILYDQSIKSENLSNYFNITLTYSIF
jgi:hypothetical protein